MLSRQFREHFPCFMLFTVDVVLISETTKKEKLRQNFKKGFQDKLVTIQKASLMEFRIEKMSSKETEIYWCHSVKDFNLDIAIGSTRAEQASGVPCNYQMPLQSKKKNL